MLNIVLETTTLEYISKTMPGTKIHFRFFLPLFGKHFFVCPVSFPKWKAHQHKNILIGFIDFSVTHNRGKDFEQQQQQQKNPIYSGRKMSKHKME